MHENNLDTPGELARSPQNNKRNCFHFFESQMPTSVFSATTVHILFYDAGVAPAVCIAINFAEPTTFEKGRRRAGISWHHRTRITSGL